MTHTTAVLQLVRLKGRVNTGVISESLSLEPALIEAELAKLTELAAVTQTNGNYRISPAGRELLAQYVSAEREQIAQPVLSEAYEKFHHLNTEFKQLVTDWQLKAGAPNDHSDKAYDQDIIERLGNLHQRFTPLLDSMSQLAGRLAPYPGRLERALTRLKSGDDSAFARPIVDSYHTVWFELHEDLIGMLGLSREEEAVAGRAE